MIGRFCTRWSTGSPGSRFRVGHAALTMAEYFRDDERRDVLLLIDNIFLGSCLIVNQ